MQAYNHGKLRSLTKAPMLALHVVGLGAFVHAVASTAVSELADEQAARLSDTA